MPANLAFAKEEQAAIVGTEHQTLKLYKGFFPYQACLQVTINQVLKKPKKVLLVNATVEDVYCGNFKNGSLISLALNDSGIAPESFSFLSSLTSKKQVIAFDNIQKYDLSFEELAKASDNPIRNLWIPYAGRCYQSKDIAELKSIIQNSPTQPAQAKAAFQTLLETKWTTNRINDFCRPETQRNWLCPFDGTPMSGWTGTLHYNKALELSNKKVKWRAEVNNNVPFLYAITVDSPDKNCAGWDIEFRNPSLEEWTAENFLMHRVGKSITQAAFAEWIINHRQQPSTSTYLGLFELRADETLIKDQSGQVTSYQCLLDNGETLTAVLTNDQLQSIDKILINGKLDPGWNNMYNQGLLNLAKCKKHLQETLARNS